MHRQQRASVTASTEKLRDALPLPLASTPSIPPPCPHLAVHRLSSRPLRFLHCLRVRPLGRPEIRRDPCELPRCSPYAAASPSPTFRLYACLSCATVFCPSHAATHASASAGLAAFAERSRRARFGGWAFVPCGAVAAGTVRGGRLAGGAGRGGIGRAVVVGQSTIQS
jgi:hypothetical protein